MTSPSTSNPNNASQANQFDYIIVGGGTAGCVLANRLSEDGTKSVLLLEAGCNEYTNKNILVPVS